MAITVPARLIGSYTASAGRKFGFTVGTAFAALAAVARWRGHPVTLSILGGLAIVLLAAALLLPARLGPVERAWMGLAGLISHVTTPVFMGVVYFGILTPIGLVRRTFSSNPLVHGPGPEGFWADRSMSPRGSLDRQF